MQCHAARIAEAYGSSKPVNEGPKWAWTVEAMHTRLNVEAEVQRMPSCRW